MVEPWWWMLEELGYLDLDRRKVAAYDYQGSNTGRGYNKERMIIARRKGRIKDELQKERKN